MKRIPIIFLAAAFLLVTAHRLPAPISEVTETATPTATPAPTSAAKPTQQQSVEPKPAKRKSKPQVTEVPVKHATPEPVKAAVTGAWHGQWDNSRGESGGVKITLTEGSGGVITGDAGPGRIENGRHIGNAVTYTFHRWGRDYQVTLNMSADGTTMNGGYKVTQGSKLIYTGKYYNFKRQ